MAQDLREMFAQEFLSTEEGLDPFDHTIEALIERYEMVLGEAHRRWPSLNIDREWSTMGDWLSENGYVEPQYR
jgi:hypothetical protein